MKFLLAPDKMKGSMTAKEAASVLERAVYRIFPDAEVLSLPVGDGGEGTMEALIYATGGKVGEAAVTGPLGNRTSARYGILGDGETGVVEAAEANGLHLIPPRERDPSKTTTYGVGELIRHLLDQGMRRFIITLGGSATNDGGVGMLQALGAEVLDKDGRQVGFGGSALAGIDRIRLIGLDPRLKETEIRVACDVSNPLIGPKGATLVFGGQKGGTPEILAALEANMIRYADVVERDTGISIGHRPGAGAAGGLGAALMLCGGRLLSGIDLVLDILSFEEKLEGVNWVFTGEGRIDQQTLYGKAVAGIVRRAGKKGIPVIAFVGSIGTGFEALYDEGLTAVIGITPGPMPLEAALENGARHLETVAESVLRIIGRTSDVGIVKQTFF